MTLSLLSGFHIFCWGTLLTSTDMIASFFKRKYCVPAKPCGIVKNSAHSFQQERYSLTTMPDNNTPFIQRSHRYRRNASLRQLFTDVTLRPSDLIAPIFLHEKEGKEALSCLPGAYRWGLDCAGEYVAEMIGLGIGVFILFPVVPESKKSLCCSYAFDEYSLIPKALRQLKRDFPQAVLIADVALDPFHIKGHDGLLDAQGQLDNDASCGALAQQSLCYALAGADIIAPSDMMDGRIGIIRRALEQRGLWHTLLLSYTAKYASCLYGPFRQAVDSARYLGGADKKSYQMDPASAFQIQLEAKQDIAEQADILMVKPGLPYLDVVADISRNTPLPVWSYHVSGECAMIAQGVQAGLFSLEDILFEQLIALKRAGAQKIVTYYASEAAHLLSR